MAKVMIKHVARFLTFMLLANAGGAIAGELAHYAPGLLNARDFFVPEPGYYYSQYHMFYSTDTLKDRNGDKVDSLTATGPLGNTTTVSVDTDVDVFAVVPTFLWVSPWNVLGARYAAAIAPSFADSSVEATLSLARSGRFSRGGTSRTLQTDTDFGLGDLFVQPAMLGWSGKHHDVSASYGFYAPIGDDGISLDFWTHQFQLAGAWYPLEHRGTAITVAATYEINSEKDNADLTPGERVSLNYGVSQYLPLNKDMTWLAEVAVTGYSQWQVRRDSGSDVPTLLNVKLNAKDKVHAVGLQAGITNVPWKAALTVRYLREYGAEARFEGNIFLVSFAKAF